MIVKGIIKSIDYSGNTCTVRIPIFESAANENEVVISAILSTLPGIYNGYKEEDVVFIAFENNDYDMPVVIGKLYLGVENEKNDPRGAIVCNNITAAQPISIPISSKLTLDNDPQHSSVIEVDKGIDSYKSIADLAKNLQKQDEKLGSLSVKVIDDGENLGAEIAKKVSITDEATKQRGLGWNLNTEKWEIYAKDTVGDTNSLAKLPIMTIDRTGMVISGNLVLTGYPQTTEIKYTNSTDKNTPPTGDDVKWQDNTNDLYTDEHYIWKRTREVFYAYNAETDKWELTKYGDAHYECITGAKGDSGYNTVTVMLYKRSKTSISGKQIDIDLYYKFSDQKLYINDTCTTDYTLPEGWYYTISGTGDSSNGDLYCIAAVAHSNTESDKIPHSEWAGPTLYVENGADGKPGDSVYTISIDNDFDSVPADVNGNVSSSYLWETETTHKVRVYYGKEAQDFTIADQNGTAPSTGLCLKYKLTNVALGNTPSVSSKVATVWINDLSADADTGNILYTLYVDGVETGITGKFSATKIKSPAPTYTISIDNDFATIPTSTVNAKIYRKASQKFKPIDNGYNRETITIAGAAKKLPGMRLSAVNNMTNLNTALLWKPDEVIKITPDITKSYVEDITKHNVTVYCNDAVETITADNFIVKLDSDGLDANMDETQNYLVCELGGFDSTGARATDFPGMNPTISDNVVTNYITALSALGDASESKNVYIQYTYYVKGKLVVTAKFEVTRHTGPTTYYLSSNVSTIKVNKDATITPNNVICTAYSLDTSTNTNTKFTNGIWRYKWDNGAWSPDKSTASDLEISTAGVITSKYKQLYIELYLDKQLWDRETINVIADGENAVDYRIIASSGTIKVTKTGNKDPQFITVDFKQINGSATPAAFSGNYKVFIDNETEPTSYGTADSIVLATSGATGQQIDVSSATSRVTVDLYTTDGSTKLESETIDVVADGADGQPGIYIKEVKQWYILKASSFQGTEQELKDIKPADNAEPTYNPAPTPTTLDKWMSTPPEAVNGYNIWTCYGSIFSDDIPEDRHIEYSTPVKDAAYALAQGKTTNYYSPTEPIYNIKKGDCWFDTGYVNIGALDNKTDYLGKFVNCQSSITGSVRVEASGTNRYIPSENGSTYLVKITPDNINKISITVGITNAYETGNLKQWDGNKWEDIAGELVTNKLTANYINALDITAKKLLIKNDSGTLLDAGWSTDDAVTIGGFTVNNVSLASTKKYLNAAGEKYDKPVVYIGTSETDKAYKVGALSTKNWRLLIGDNFGVTDNGKLVVQEGTFSGSISASGGTITNMTTIQGDSVECSKLSLTNGCVISTTALADDSATTTTAVKFTFSKNRSTDGGDWSSGYIGGDSYYSLTIHANRQLAKPTNIGTLVSVTLEVPIESSGGSGAGTTVHKIYFNKSIIFPANVLQTSVCITGATFGSPGTVHKIKELTFDKANFSSSDGITYTQTIECLTPEEKYVYSSEFSSNIVPKNTTLNLGDPNRRWNDVYAANMYATAFYASSDKRLKENIKEFEPKNSILNLPVVEFDFKDSGKHQIGCIAQDLQKLFPELVETRDDGYLTIEENKLVYLLLLEIKKLNQRINILETNLSNMTSNKELK